jgi:hypothetical protein
MIANTTDRHGITWIKCQECGDSKKSRNKAHCMVDDKGSTFCFRCGHSTQLDIGSLIDIALGDKTIDEALDDALARDREEAYVWTRGTVLQQYAIQGENHLVSYEMRDCNGNRTGWHNRNTRIKECENEGRRGIGYAGDNLVSSPSSPLIIVEGPADVITDRHVCVFGTISASSLKHCRLQYCWLQPDPDQIDTVINRRKFINKVYWPAINDGMVFCQGIIVGNGDPDEATVLVHYSNAEIVQGMF